MKGKLFKKLGAAIFAAALFATGFTVRASADDSPTIESFTTDDFARLTGKNIVASTSTGTDGIRSGKIIVEKRISTVSNTNFTTKEPVRNVVFSIVKIGEYAKVTENNATSVMIGMKRDFVEAVWPKKGFELYYEEMLQNSDYYYMDAELYNSLNSRLAAIGNAFNVAQWTGNAVPVNTGDDGEASLEVASENFGIYLVAEGDVSMAQTPVYDEDGKINDWENALFSKKQYPYLVSVPYNSYTVTDDGSISWTKDWSVIVNARAKNENTEINIIKKIERNSSSLTGNRNNQADTDVTHVNDTVEFTLTADVPMIEKHESVQSYIITDEISAGYTLPTAFSASNIKITDSSNTVYKIDTDYEVSLETVSGTDYANRIIINFLEDKGDNADDIGLEKVANLARNRSGNQKIYVSYTAVVNKNAVVGQKGNPNRVKLNLRAAGSGDIETDWDEVKEFIFSLEGNKTFDGIKNPKNAEEVSFELYLDADCTKPINLTNVGNGKYIYAGEAVGTDPKPTKIKLDEDSSFTIKGVPVSNEDSTTSVTLYLKETATAPGYNKLTKVVPIVLTAASVNNEYSGLLLETGTTVNGKQATIISVDDEGVEVSAGVSGSKSGASFTVNNTTGFQLPSTGGTGIWMFVIGGILVIACGVLYYRRNAGRS